MSKKKDPKLYELILDWTQSGNLLWKRLDDEETNDPFVKRATDDMNIDLIESFYTNISSGTIYVISDFGGDPALFVQPNGGAALTEFDVSTPQINQLKNAIKDQVDDVTEFIESLEKWSDFFISFKLLLLLEQLTLNQRAQGSSPWKRTTKPLFLSKRTVVFYIRKRFTKTFNCLQFRSESPAYCIATAPGFCFQRN
ncbi:hypothetical protein JXX19_07515 [Ruthenibacterium lactatiformans]|nr:hypothetical protein [Ruthenibacterium lactatiformans]MBN3026271.1 hypothetical protein [Ruthenibacterium lactatiformans]